MTALVTDSATDLAPEIVARYPVATVPLTVTMGEQVVTGSGPAAAQAFLSALTQTGVVPKTAAPAPGAFLEAYRRWRQPEPDDIVSIHLAGALSATVQAARLGAELLGPTPRVHVIDSGSASVGTGLLVWWAARRLFDHQVPARAVADEVEQLKRRLVAWLVPQSLDYLAQSGRIGKAAHWVGARLDLKPILVVEAGVIGPGRAVRGARQVSAGIRGLWAARLASDTPVLVGWAHGGHAEAFEPLRAWVHQQYRVIGEFQTLTGPGLRLMWARTRGG
jgi:DegV family protein with EDD domain